MNRQVADKLGKVPIREDIMNIEEWYKLAERGTSGDMVYDILRDWKNEVSQIQQWINDLQSGMYVNCVYCGHRYGPKDEVPVSMAEVLKQHIEICPKHPMSKLKKELDILKQYLTDTSEDMECLERCDSYGHEEDCPVANPMAAFRKLRNRNKALEDVLRSLDEHGVNCPKCEIDILNHKKLVSDWKNAVE